MWKTSFDIFNCNCKLTTLYQAKDSHGILYRCFFTAKYLHHNEILRHKYALLRWPISTPAQNGQQVS